MKTIFERLMQWILGKQNKPPVKHAILYVKGSERYVFIYTKEYRPAIVYQMFLFAMNPDLSFSERDARKTAAEVRRQCGVYKEPGIHE